MRLGLSELKLDLLLQLVGLVLIIYFSDLMQVKLNHPPLYVYIQCFTGH